MQPTWVIDRLRHRAGRRPHLRPVAGGQGRPARSHRGAAVRIAAAGSRDPARRRHCHEHRHVGWRAAARGRTPSFLATWPTSTSRPARPSRPSSRARRFWLPLVLFVALHVAFTAVWTQKVDACSSCAKQIEESGTGGPLPPEQLAVAAIEQGVLHLSPGSVALVVLALLVTGLVLSCSSSASSSAATSRSSSRSAVLAWTFLTVALVTVPLLLVDGP